jgi:ubiquitin-protein ligase E3 C
MLPVFEFSDSDSKRRKINLGGSSSASSHAVILQQVRAQRTEREETRRRQENAIRLQAWWRGLQGARAFRKEIRSTFQQDITGITGLRCLLLMGDDEEALALWSNTIVSSGEGQIILLMNNPCAKFVSAGALFHLANGSQRGSWLTLVRQASYRLLCSVAKSPQ